MYQKLTLIGYVGRDPETKTFENGGLISTFALATTRKVKNRDGNVDSVTTWFRCSAWNKTAEVVSNYVHKGSKVMVEGVLTCDQATGSPRIYTRNDGTVGCNYDVAVNSLVLLDSKQNNSGENNQAARQIYNSAPAANAAQPTHAAPAASYNSSYPTLEEDDIPF